MDETRVNAVWDDEKFRCSPVPPLKRDPFLETSSEYCHVVLTTLWDISEIDSFGTTYCNYTYRARGIHNSLETAAWFPNAPSS
jgi:hypothetical protein